MKRHLPNLLTLSSGVAGLCVVLILIGQGSIGGSEHVFAWIFWLIVAAVIFDTIDGPVARVLKVQSPMGAQLDNLCDATTFGLAVAASIVSFMETLLPPSVGFISYILGAFWLIAVLIRLARFSIDQESANPTEAHYFFRGLCSPVAALFAVSLMKLAFWVPAVQYLAPFLLLLAAVLMISNFSFADLPKHYLGRRRPFWELVPFAVVAPFFSVAGSLALYLGLFIGLSLASQFRKV